MTKLHKKDKKMVGVLLSEELYEKFILLTLAENLSKTKLGETIIEIYMRSNRKLLTKENLLGRIKENVQKEWRGCRSRNMDFNTFKTDIHSRLIAEGLCNTHITSILDFEENEKN